MKKLSIIILLLTLGLADVQASHFAGAAISYEYTGVGDVYRIWLTLYRRCEPGAIDLATTESITYSCSASTGGTLSVPTISLDTTVYEVCEVPPIVCNGAPGPFTPIITRVYSATVSLLPASDWKLRWTNSGRQYNLTNLTSPASQSITIEAVLNNLNGSNSNVKAAAFPRVMANNHLQVTPLNTVDADQDSVVYEPLDRGYLAPYTAVNPLNGVTKVAGDKLNLKSNAVGTYVYAFRIKEFRNGQLVGYCDRDWSVQAITANVRKPYAVAGAPTVVNSMPGQSHSITVNFADSIPSDSVFASMLPTNLGFPFTVNVVQGLAAASVTVSWTTPANFTQSSFNLDFSAWNKACPFHGYTQYTVPVIVQQPQTGIDPSRTSGIKASIVPNPSGNTASLLLQLPYEEQVSVSITDLAGRIAWKESINAKKGVQSIDIPAAQLQSGIYLVRIEAAGGQQVMKWTKQ